MRSFVDDGVDGVAVLDDLLEDDDGTAATAVGTDAEDDELDSELGIETRDEAVEAPLMLLAMLEDVDEIEGCGDSNYIFYILIITWLWVLR